MRPGIAGLRRRKLAGAVVVITGASSGIGRAAAVRFAEAGSAVVLAARREQALREVARDCERAGGRATVVPTDVTDDEAVEALARRAVEDHGRIDVWINNAGVSMFGSFEDSPADVYSRVLDINLGGCIRGARAVLPIFRSQGTGVLINNASVYGKVAVPYASAYVASKHGIVGLSASLRTELLGHDIAVCTLLPSSIDTPIFQQSANYAGRTVKPIDPVYDADVVAKAMVSLAARPRREHIVGGAGRMLRKQRLLAPALFERGVKRLVEFDHFGDDPAPATSGNVRSPGEAPTSVSGGWSSSPGPIRRALPAVLAAAGAVVVSRRRRDS